MAKRYVKYPKRYVQASISGDDTSYEYMTPEQSKIVDKIEGECHTLAEALINAYEQKNVFSSAGKTFCEGQIEGMAFAAWQLGVIGFSEYNTLTED